MDEAAAEAFARELEVERLPACAMCLFELAWALYQGRRVHPSTVTRTVSWVWLEIDDALRELVVAARMRELPGAEEALADLDARGVRGRLARAVVVRLAELMAEEIAARQAR
ncbi:MAG: hypothetical protein ICV64_02285 [Thermoleophilia bacterium]|nr:hypothetical protein [Thermoleophilia bacterium]